MLRIVEREITRSAGGGEHHVPICAHAFAQRRSAGHYLLHWQAHGVDYGIPCSARAQLDRGLSVLTIASRAVLPAARALPSSARFIAIHAPLPVLRQASLRARRPRRRRDRRTRSACRRVHRRRSDMHAIDNGGALADSGAAFMRVLAQLTGTRA